ncbi:calcium/sodium antiporter [Mucisphaera sp.]|uniref:calcium/sodium antiporter n=1 Tax=Mucisphaera sp. TaxID=2913024 RepID=UPI003D152F57
MNILLILLGLVLLTAGGETLIRGASRLAAAAGIPPLLVGLTVVAFGTSAPELAVSIKAALTGEADLALGNVVGSNTFNILLILGLSALILPLSASMQLIRLDVPVMVGVSVVAWFLAGNGLISRFEGVLLAIGLVAYTAFQIRLGLRLPAADGAPSTSTRLWPALLGIAVGLTLLVLGSRALVDGATAIAQSFGVSELMIGLTVIASGTSLPEVATSVIAAVRGQRDLAIGNVVGSNIFNILGVLGIAAALSPAGIAVAPAALRFDIPIMVAVAFACLPIFITAGRIDRWEGGLFLFFYAAYLVFLVLAATTHPGLNAFTSAMAGFVIPLVVVTLALSLIYTRAPRS